MRMLLASLSACVCLSTAAADNAHPSQAGEEKAKPEKAKPEKAKPEKVKPKSAKKAADSSEAPSGSAAEADPMCKLGEAEQPRGGRLDVLGDRFGSAPVVRIAGKPARILIRKQDRISVQVPADSNGGEITLLNDGKVASCGTLVIIGKNR